MMPDSGLGGGVMGSSERSITQMSLEPGSECVVCYIKFGPVFILNTQLAKVCSYVCECLRMCVSLCVCVCANVVGVLHHVWVCVHPKHAAGKGVSLCV